MTKKQILGEELLQAEASVQFLFNNVRACHKVAIESEEGALEILFSDLLPQVIKIQQRLALIQLQAIKD